MKCDTTRTSCAASAIISFKPAKPCKIQSTRMHMAYAWLQNVGRCISNHLSAACQALLRKMHTCGFSQWQRALVRPFKGESRDESLTQMLPAAPPLGGALINAHAQTGSVVVLAAHSTACALCHAPAYTPTPPVQACMYPLTQRPSRNAAPGPRHTQLD
jgi:hypothetical protein